MPLLAMWSTTTVRCATSSAEAAAAPLSAEVNSGRVRQSMRRKNARNHLRKSLGSSYSSERGDDQNGAQHHPTTPTGGSTSLSVPLLSRCLLTPLGVPLTGPLVQMLLTTMARLQFLNATPVTVYCRHSTAPSLSDANPQSTLASSSSLQFAAGGDLLGGSRPSLTSATLGHGILSGCHPSLYIGRSLVHGRGVFTRTRFRKGERLITVPEMWFIDGVQFLFTCAGTHAKVPGTLHYTLPTGRLREFVLGSRAHHLLNHSCAANVCTGLSRRWWWEGSRGSTTATTTSPPSLLDAVEERMATFAHFDDPNSFFAARDIEAGEELTLDYHGRFGYVTRPLRARTAATTLSAHEGSSGGGALRWMASIAKPRNGGAFEAAGDDDDATSVGHVIDCRCGQPSCRGGILPVAPVCLPQASPLEVFKNVSAASTISSSSGGASSPLVDLDELTMISMLNDPFAVTNHIEECLKPLRRGLQLPTSAELEAEGSRWKSHTSNKTTILTNYRHAFKTLDAVEPSE